MISLAMGLIVFLSGGNAGASFSPSLAQIDDSANFYCGSNSAPVPLEGDFPTHVCLIESKTLRVGLNPLLMIRFYFSGKIIDLPLLEGYPDQKMGFERKAYILRFAIADVHQDKTRMSNVFLSYQEFQQTLSLDRALLFGNTLDGIPFQVPELSRKPL